MKEIALSIIVGILGHQLERPTNSWFPLDVAPDVNRLVRYAEGGFLIVINVAIWARATLPPRLARMVIGIVSNAILTLGTGVVVGYIVDGIIKQRRSTTEVIS